MKKTNLFFSALLALVLLGGCTNTPSSTSNNEPSISTSSNSTSSSSGQNDGYQEITVPDGYELSSKINISGELIDISAGEWLTVGFEYSFSFTFTNENATDPIVTSSDESILKVVKDGSSSYKLQCLKASDAILTIKESDEYETLHYRAVVHVHNAMSLEEAKSFLVDTSYFACTTVGWTPYNCEFIFTSSSEFSLNILNEANAIGETYSGNYEFASEQADEFIFNISNIQIGDGSLKLRTFHLYMNGYQLAVIDSQGLFGFFTPTNI